MYYLIVYDITNPKRLAKVAKILENCAIRIQYSVFVADILASKFNELVRQLEAVIDAHEDGIKYFTLCEPCLHSRQAIGKVLPQNLSTPFVVI